MKLDIMSVNLDIILIKISKANYRTRTFVTSFPTSTKAGKYKYGDWKVIIIIDYLVQLFQFPQRYPFPYYKKESTSGALFKMYIRERQGWLLFTRDTQILNYELLSLLTIWNDNYWFIELLTIAFLRFGQDARCIGESWPLSQCTMHLPQTAYV